MTTTTLRPDEFIIRLSKPVNIRDLVKKEQDFTLELVNPHLPPNCDHFSYEVIETLLGDKVKQATEKVKEMAEQAPV